MSVRTFEELEIILKKNYSGTFQPLPSLTEKAKKVFNNPLVYKHGDCYCFFLADLEKEIDFYFVDDRPNAVSSYFENGRFKDIPNDENKELIEKCFEILKEDPKLRLLAVTGVLSEPYI